MENAKRWGRRFGAGVALLFLVSVAASAATIPLSLTPAGTVGISTVFSASLTGLGLSYIGSIDIVDDGTPIGGLGGILSGFDLDAVFLDFDGILTTTGDRVFASEFLFTAGSTRPTRNPTFQTSPTRPTFGSLGPNTIDTATTTLNDLDALIGGTLASTMGFLTLGDSGQLVANFFPHVSVGDSLFLFAGELSVQTVEGISAAVTVSDEVVAPIPEPGTLILLGSGLLVLAGRVGKSKPWAQPRVQ